MDDELLAAPPLTAKDLASRAGFDENFLGQFLPMPALSGVETVLLPYTHFSVSRGFRGGPSHHGRTRHAPTQKGLLHTRPPQTEKSRGYGSARSYE